MTRVDIANYGERELFLWIENDEGIYTGLNNGDLGLEDLGLFFNYTRDQLDYVLDNWKPEVD